MRKIPRCLLSPLSRVSKLFYSVSTKRYSSFARNYRGITFAPEDERIKGKCSIRPSSLFTPRSVLLYIPIVPSPLPRGENFLIPDSWNDLEDGIPLKFNVFNLNSQRSLRNVTELCNIAKNIGNSFSSKERERKREKRTNLSMRRASFDFSRKMKILSVLFIGNNFCISRPSELLVSFVHIIINFPAGIDG